MKYILIVGTKDAGKSTTIDAICKKLNPTAIKRLNYPDRKRFEDVNNTIIIDNGTYLIEVNGKMILIVAGAPTEQGITITVLFELCFKFQIKIDYAIVAMRSFEKRDGHDTRNELMQFGECLLDERIWQIYGENFKESIEWKARINKMVELIQLEVYRINATEGLPIVVAI
ncbi:MAG: hypothetical protein JWQ38_1417 [Flavipsychrobacter sp.]|nr:hypothetical protein [Flavipsychrobacter sp.]